MYRLNVQIAKTPEDWRVGARRLEGKEEDAGIFLLYPRETIPTFSTKGISFPLDILLIDKESHIIGIFEKASGDKYYAFPCAAVAALEVAGGFCEKRGVSVGDRVSPLGISLKPKEARAPQQGERKLVEAQLQENIEKHPSDPESYEELAVFYTLNGENEKAVQTFRDLLGLGITAPRLNGLGVSLAQLGKWEEAASYFRQAIQTAPRFLGSYQNLAKYYLHKNEPDRAIALYEEAIGLYADFLDAYLGLCRLYLAKGDGKAATSCVKKARKNGLKSPKLDRTAGDIALRCGKLREAAQYYQRYLNQRPFDEDAPELKAFVLIHSTRSREAVQ